MQLETWLTFCTIALIAAAIPGPAILLVSSHSLQFGIKRSLVAATGNVTGLFVMSACSISGLSALVAISSTAFNVIKGIGIFYLFYLGIKIWRSGVQLEKTSAKSSVKFSAWELYSQGLLISLTNPKAIIFTSALFPQFISLSQPLLPQFFILVSTLMACSLFCLFSYSLLSQKLKAGTEKYISNSALGKIFGAIFISSGGALLISTQK